MLIDLTLKVDSNSDSIKWAKAQKNPHVALGHVGTHLDTYNKSFIPLEYFKSNLVFFDVRDITEVDIENLDLSLVNNGDFVLFRTGQMEKYGYGNKEYFDNHPCLSKSLITALIAKGIRFIGIDAAGIRKGNEHVLADKLCEDNGIYVIENLTNLELIKKANYNVFTMWLDDETMTGLKCRVILEEKE